MNPQAAQNWARQELALSITERAFATLEKNGIRAMPVKGLVLARQVYDITERPISDVDLLVEPADVRRALAVARTEGWTVVWDTRLVGSFNFVLEGLAFDLKSSLGPPGMSALGVSTMLARAVETRESLGFLHRRIELHDHVLLLAIDAFKDGLGRGKPWAREDLVRLAAVADFSARSLVDRAIDARLQTMLALVADWVLASGPAPSWSTIRELVQKMPLRSHYIARYRRLLAVTTGSVPRWRLSAMTRTVSDSPWKRALALALGAAGTARFMMRHGGLDVDAWDAHRPRRSP
jgi:hypothetical protein